MPLAELSGMRYRYKAAADDDGDLDADDEFECSLLW